MRHLGITGRLSVLLLLLALSLACGRAAQRGAERTRRPEQGPAPVTRSAAAPAPAAAPPSSNRIQFLGGHVSECTDVPFLIAGQDRGIKTGITLGMYKNGGRPQFGPSGEAEFRVESGGVITVTFRPRNNYQADDPAFNGVYFLNVGLLPDSNALPGGCGYKARAPLPTGGRRLHFKGEIRYVSAQSRPPAGSGAGNILLGGLLAYDFPDGAQNVVAIDNFSGGPNPPSLAQARYECGPPPPDDWWHDLMWADWWHDGLADRWVAFDVDITAAHEKAVASSKPVRRGEVCGRDLSTATSVSVLGLFVGPEFSIRDGYVTFQVRNLRAEVQ